MNIPFVNLKRMHDRFRNEIDEAVKSIIDSNNYIMGKPVEQFETGFAEYLGVKHVIGMSSGTDALFLALKVLNIHNGDWVITVPHTFIATSEAITMAGGKVVFVDVDKKSSNMSPTKLEHYLNSLDAKSLKKVKAVIFVNLYGSPEDLDNIYSITKKYGIPLISDAAQAHGARIDNKPITDFADLTTYSFFPGKNLGAFGDAGAVGVNDWEKADKLKMIRNHGRTEKYIHPVEAFNCRMDTLQAAILDVKLRYLEDWNRHRIKSAKLYNTLLEKKGYDTPTLDEKYRRVFHLYVIRVKDREKIITDLGNKGVSTGIHYPLPLHLQPAYEYLGYKKGDFPACEKLSEEILSLPIDGTITEEEIGYICNLLPDYK